MNRLAPLITPVPLRSGPARAIAIDPVVELPQWSLPDDVRQFLTAFAGGFIFFVTLFG